MKNIRNYPDAARIRVTDSGDWTLALPDGTFRRGNAATPEDAFTAAEAARDRWILDRWNKGSWSKQANRKLWVITVQ